MNVAPIFFWSIYAVSMVGILAIGILVFFRKHFITTITEWMAKRKGGMAYIRMIDSTGELVMSKIIKIKSPLPKIDSGNNIGRYTIDPLTKIMVRGIPEYTFLEGKETPFDYFSSDKEVSKGVGADIIDNFIMKMQTTLSNKELMKWLKMSVIMGIIIALLVIFVMAMLLTGKGGEAGEIVKSAIKI